MQLSMILYRVRVSENQLKTPVNKIPSGVVAQQNTYNSTP